MAKLTAKPSATPLTLAIAYRALDSLKLDSGNPRAHAPRQIRQIAQSIGTFGFSVPVLIDGAGQVAAGHGRCLAARQLGMTEVPTITLAHLSKAQARAFMLADNRLAENATWDNRLLGQVLLELSQADLDFSLEVTGFEAAEIDLRIAELGEADHDAADALPAPTAGPAVIRPGDLWLLGPHRLLCGDATDPVAYTALMQKQAAAVVFTDPPYNVPIDGHVSGLGQIRHREFVMAAGEMTKAQFTTFLTAALRQVAAHSGPGSLHFVCMDWRHMGELLAAGDAAYTELKNLCVWAKDNAGMGSLYRSQHELVFVFKHGTAPHRNNVALGRHGRNRTNVWRYPGINTLRRRSEESDLLALHPTVKPVALVADALLDASARGDVVLDPFLGSGTTLIAAERVGRRGYGLELDPLYCDTIIRRWQAWSGGTARLAGVDGTFDEIAASRSSEATAAQAAHTSPAQEVGDGAQADR